jgi:hypothetical protein
MTLIKAPLAVALLFVVAVPADSQPAATPIDNQQTSGRLPLTACATLERTRLKAETLRIAEGRNPAGAWVVAESMLCSEHAPISNMPELVLQEQYGLTDPPGPSFALVPRHQVQTFAGRAYGVTIERHKQDIRFYFQTAGICSGVFALRPVASNWLLVEVGEACD